MERENRLQFRVSNAELDIIKADAEKDGMSLSDYLRYAVLQEGGSRPSCGNEILGHIKAVHEDADKLYLYVQEYYSKHENDLADIICSRWIEFKIHELNKKLRYITSVLEKLGGTTMPPYEDLSFSDYKANSKFYK